jgi:hypothetical protein
MAISRELAWMTEVPPDEARAAFDEMARTRQEEYGSEEIRAKAWGIRTADRLQAFLDGEGSEFYAYFAFGGNEKTSAFHRQVYRYFMDEASLPDPLEEATWLRMEDGRAVQGYASEEGAWIEARPWPEFSTGAMIVIPLQDAVLVEPA